MKENPLRAKVREVYGGIAVAPEAAAPFPTGRALAEDVGYPPGLLDSLPAESVEAFCGVLNVSVSAPLSEGATVLDLGCGAGLDSLVAARRVGLSGRVIGVDFSPEMLERAARATAGDDRISLHLAGAERLPLEEASVDVALVNGIFNLNPDRQAVFGELSRVLRPGGTARVAELILAEGEPPPGPPTEDDWFR